MTPNPEHTPGPWTVGRFEGHPHFTVRTDEKAIAYITDHRLESRADANLCASAPDLLAACKAALGYLTENEPIDPKYAHMEPMIFDVLRAAIAKAEGK